MSPAVTDSQSLSPPPWDTSAPSTVAREELDLPSLRFFRRELDLAFALLSEEDLERDQSFWSYTQELKAALTAYERSVKQRPEMLMFARTLAQARTNLQERISTLPLWLITQRITGAEADRFAPLPARFRRTEPVALVPEAHLSPDVVDTWMMAALLPSI